MILYRIVFERADGIPYRLDTTDQAKIGPWLAEMYGLYPYDYASPNQVKIQTVNA
jgi:hypothetical protein